MIRQRAQFLEDVGPKEDICRPYLVFEREEPLGQLILHLVRLPFRVFGLADGVDAVLIDYPVNPKEIARKIELLTEEQTRLKIGKLARKKALNYSVQSNAETTLKLYEEILSRSLDRTYTT